MSTDNSSQAVVEFDLWSLQCFVVFHIQLVKIVVYQW